jgi:hypothetical protein
MSIFLNTHETRCCDYSVRLLWILCLFLQSVFVLLQTLVSMLYICFNVNLEIYCDHLCCIYKKVSCFHLFKKLTFFMFFDIPRDKYYDNVEICKKMLHTRVLHVRIRHIRIIQPIRELPTQPSIAHKKMAKCRFTWLLSYTFSEISFDNFILPSFLDIRCTVFCKKIQNIRCITRLWDFFTQFMSQSY